MYSANSIVGTKAQNDIMRILCIKLLEEQFNDKDSEIYKKCLELAAHKSSKYYLAIVSFLESSFFPIPPDVMVIPMVISKKNDVFNMSAQKL